MTQPFVGKVEFQTAVDHKTRLTVDPDSPTSALLISNQDGSRVISIGDPNGNVALPNDLSATRIFVAGRPDLGGLIRVSDRNGREVISIDADARTIRISNPDNSRVIDLGGPNGNVALPNDLSATRIFVAGRPDLGGLIRVSDRNGREVISIDADARTIRISNPDNSRVIDLGGPNGNVALPNDLSATRIFVAGRPDLGGLIRVSDRNGREVISIDADARTIRISNPDNSRVIDLGGPNGNVALPNDLSATRIFVAGRPDLGGLIRVSDRNGREVISIDADARTIRISNPDNSRVIDLGGPNGNVALPNDLSATRIFVAGRPDLGGLIRVSDRNGREVISIDADARTIRISNPDNSRVIDLGGPNGNVALPNDLSATRIFVAGRPDLGGLIRVSDRNGREVISIDADARTIRISNPDNSRVIDLGGPNGNVALPNDLSATRIFVAGRPDLGGLIRVSDRNGREVISIDADARTIRISNPDNSRVIDLGGPNGNVALPNDLSATRIFVAGRPDLGGLIRVSDRNGRDVISIDADARTIRISNPDNSRVIDLGGP